MAERGAVVDAQRNLLEITEGVRVNGETVVKDYITQSDIIFSRVDGIVKGLKQPDWPADGWQALHRLASLLCTQCAGSPPPRSGSAGARR
jgi:hypothetical protein